MDTRNPSPPPGIDPPLEQNDQIGNSAYSKRWLYSLILQVLTKINKCEEGINEHEEELESSLEEELCCLWDITTDQALLTHLRPFQLVPVFTECIHKSHCPRLIEISLGVLANLSLDEEQCGLLSEEQAFMLLRSVLASRLHRQVWLDAIHFALEFIDRVNFILCSSTNATLLMSTISAIETILRIDDSLCELWCNEDLLGSLQEAQKQMCWIHGDDAEVIYRLLYLFSTNPTGVRTLNDLSLDGLWRDLSVLFGDLIQRVREYIQGIDCGNKPSGDLDGLLYWLHDIEEGGEGLREAFVRCCLCRRAGVGVADAEDNAVVEVLRGHLVFVCQRLCLSKLLECSTTDHS
ncbi:unnamed protein product [Hydatigera taeniaeformis]|uniref:Protein saal1 n=1 Tax=Hydatigena taeniaeformis TaxID=6205 RepID=A0A158REI0_HYDTA|nr:unnamed protein product [Hydatigera taeniaeformis]